MGRQVLRHGPDWSEPEDGRCDKFYFTDIECQDRPQRTEVVENLRTRSRRRRPDPTRSSRRQERHRPKQPDAPRHGTKPFYPNAKTYPDPKTLTLDPETEPRTPEPQDRRDP